jgi:hypothetical protein
MKNYSKLILVCSLLLFSLGAFAQKVGNDVLYLNDGSIIRGTVIEYIVDDHVKIMTIDEQLFTYTSDKVREVTFDQTSTTVASKHKATPQSKGYYNLTGIGLLFGQNVNQTKASMSLQMINGYQVNKHWSVGLGLGIESFDYLHIPTFADVRYQFSDRSTSPFFAFQSGYCWPLFNGQNDFEQLHGGPMAGVEFGIRNYYSDKAALVMSFGYRYQRLRNDTQQWWEEGFSTTRIDHLNRIAVRFALLFN